MSVFARDLAHRSGEEGRGDESYRTNYLNKGRGWRAPSLQNSEGGK